MIAIDATVLTLVLNPRSDSPPDPTTGKPVPRAKDRVDFLIQTLHTAKQTIVIPAPVLSEVLVRAGSNGLAYLNVMQKAAVFDIRDFDKLAAIELALMTQAAIQAGDKRERSTEPWQKIKIDRQVVAICKVAGVSTLYATDRSLANFAGKAGIRITGIHELPLPPEPPQITMDQWLAAQQISSDEPKPEEIDSDESQDEGDDLPLSP
jgi:predicted nucleic acid-binding protein